MSKWKSFYTKKNKDRFKEDLKKQLKERDENLKENWQKWHDERGE